jgi:minor extracellular serine protease Vpr
MRTLLHDKTRLLLFTVLIGIFLSANGGAAKTDTPQTDRSRKSDAKPETVDKIDPQLELQRALRSPAVITVMVELKSEPVVLYAKRASLSMGPDQKLNLETSEAQAYEAQLISEQQNFEARARQLAPKLEVVAELRTLVNAIAIEARGIDVAAIAGLPEVKRLELSREYHATLNRSVSLINGPAAWTKVGGPSVAGQGIKIAVLDTGIDITNPLFAPASFTPPAGFPKGDTSFTNNKVIAARAFGVPNPTDQNGHGTNVAGIAAGNLNTPSPLAQISGVAPRAFLGNYRVLDASGNGSDTFIIQGLQAALADGFDVANLSLGGPATPILGILDQAVENAVAAGMNVAIAAGNDGDAGAGTIQSPGVAPSAITVGSTSNSHVVGPGAGVTVAGTVPANLVNIGTTVGQGGAASSVLTGTLGPAMFVNADPANRGCVGLSGGSLTGKIAVIERGNCTFSTKITSASSAGAVGVVIYNKSTSEGADGGDTMLIMDVSGPPPVTIPSVFMTRTSGLALLSWLSSHAGSQLSMTAVSLIDLANPEDVISSFSSRGPSSLRTLKPDLAAPGDPIYSGAITGSTGSVSDPSGFAAVSGTSQATPHVAGAAALLKQLHPTWTPLQIKSALISSANNSVFSDSTKTVKAGVLDTGSGRADLALATSVSATFSPASLSFGNVSVGSQQVQRSLDLQITNQSGGANTYSVSIQNLSPGTGITVSPSAPSVSPSPGQSATVTINLTAAGSAGTGDRTGYVVITDQANQVLRVPYWVSIVPPPTLQFNSTIFSIPEAPLPPGAIAQSALIIVTRSGDSSTTVSVDFAASDLPGSNPPKADQRTDYTTASGTLTFAPGETVKTFDVPIIDDGYTEMTEIAGLTLSNAVGANLGSPSQAVLSIDDDDDNGNATSSPLDDPAYFVRQHYFDFLNRVPDTGGFNFWVSQIAGPPACGNAPCLTQRRISVSNAFFFELEFQQTGAYVFRLYRTAYGNDQPFRNTDGSNLVEAKKLPSYAVFSSDRAKVVGGSNLAQQQLLLANLFVLRPEFLAKYPASLSTAAQFVDAVLANIQSDLAVDLTGQRNALITLYNSGGRGAVMYRLADDNLQTNPINNRPLIDKEYNRAFVTTQYFGYLRRDPDIGGILFWLDQVDSAPLRDLGKQNAMVCSFITSDEYQKRFSPVAPHSNGECPH